MSEKNMDWGRDREEAARKYHALMVAENVGAPVDWPTVNRSILARWSMAGLEYIKKRAWDQIPGGRDE